MTEQLKHECGVAMIRLRKPLSYYKNKYGTRGYGLAKLYLMMEKQHNRGQEGAGIAGVNLDTPPGQEYMFREKAEGKDAITEIFSRLPAPADHGDGSADLSRSDCDQRNRPHDQRGANVISGTVPVITQGWYGSQLLMGHLRYSTTGKSGLQYVHPFLRRNNWRAKNLCLCGNFNMTNIDEVFHRMIAQGQSPRIYSDSYITLELMGHRLDREVERNFEAAKRLGLTGLDITRYIEQHVDMARVLQTTMTDYDGGYVMCGITGSGEMFAMRDPWGIRPAFYYCDDEVVALASERPVLQTTFDLPTGDITELQPGEALIVGRSGDMRLEQIIPQRDCKACSFERIYFSRGSDSDIYRERKQLGEQLTPAILQAIDGDVDGTVFSFIPNTAEVAFYGMVEGFRRAGHDVRTEKVAWKDIKLRTFITEAGARRDLASHVYDITYGSLRPREDRPSDGKHHKDRPFDGSPHEDRPGEAGSSGDNLVIIDDSIVRGTTLRESIFQILDRLHPRKIVMVSSSPQIRYPDYYGIDMARLEELAAFRAAIALIEERGMWQLPRDVYQRCLADKTRNHVRDIYAPFTVDEINRKMVEMLRPEGMTTPIQLVFQSIEGLHDAIPRHRGDWYFTGHYPTPGGTRLVNQAFINYIDSRK